MDVQTLVIWVGMVGVIAWALIAGGNLPEDDNDDSNADEWF